MKKKLLLLALPLVLCASAWALKHKLDATPANVLARYPQDANFQMVVRSHLKLHGPGTLGAAPSRHLLLLTSYFLGTRTNVIMWGEANTKGKGQEYREVVDWAIQANHPFQWNAQQLSTIRTLLKQLPPSEPPKSRGDLLIVSFESGKQWQTRVYNKKAIPPSMRQILGLMYPKYVTF